MPFSFNFPSTNDKIYCDMLGKLPELKSDETLDRVETGGEIKKTNKTHVSVG